MIKRTSTSKNDRIKLIQANAQIEKLNEQLKPFLERQERIKQRIAELKAQKGESPKPAEVQSAESAQPSLNAQQTTESGENKQ